MELQWGGGHLVWIIGIVACKQSRAARRVIEIELQLDEHAKAGLKCKVWRPRDAGRQARTCASQASWKASASTSQVSCNCKCCAPSVGGQDGVGRQQDIQLLEQLALERLHLRHCFHHIVCPSQRLRQGGRRVGSVVW